MPNFIQSGFVTLKTALLIGVLTVTPVAILVVSTGITFAKPDTKVCVSAAWRANTNIVSYYGDCPEASLSPSNGSTAIPTETPTPTVTPAPAPTSTQDPEVTPTPTLTPTESPSPSDTPSSVPSETQGPTPEVTPTVDPAPFPTPTAAPTATSTPDPTPIPTHSPDVTVSPTPVASSPVVPPAPDPVPIPPENTDPKTKSFRFCHNGGMLSNSYTGMMNGHHGNHPEDIIPPIPFKFYGGWNWNATNAKTFYNNCVPVK